MWIVNSHQPDDYHIITTPLSEFETEEEALQECEELDEMNPWDDMWFSVDQKEM